MPWFCRDSSCLLHKDVIKVLEQHEGEAVDDAHAGEVGLSPGPDQIGSEHDGQVMMGHHVNVLPGCHLQEHAEDMAE